MKKLTTYLLLTAMAISLSGCGSSSKLKQLPASLAGINIADLQEARSSGVQRLFSAAYNETYDTMVAKARANHLIIYQESRKDGILVIMGFSKQVNTTRVGIFIESAAETETLVTLSSLSTTALKKAENVFFY